MKKENLLPDDFFDVPADAKFVKMDKDYLDGLSDAEKALEDYVRAHTKEAQAFAGGGARPNAPELAINVSDEELRDEVSYFLKRISEENDPEAQAANLAASLLLTGIAGR